MDISDARSRFAGARVARLATADGDGRPHLVPVTFAATADRITIAIDHKPKRTNNLKRLRNIGTNPSVSVIVDHYADDWESLWWVRADGSARVVIDETERVRYLAPLQAKYPQYRDHPPEGPVIDIEVTRWSSWAYSD